MFNIDDTPPSPEKIQLLSETAYIKWWVLIKRLRLLSLLLIPVYLILVLGIYSNTPMIAATSFVIGLLVGVPTKKKRKDEGLFVSIFLGLFTAVVYASTGYFEMNSMFIVLFAVLLMAYIYAADVIINSKSEYLSETRRFRPIGKDELIEMVKAKVMHPKVSFYVEKVMGMDRPIVRGEYNMLVDFIEETEAALSENAINELLKTVPAQQRV